MVFAHIALDRNPSLSNSESPVITHTVINTTRVSAGLHNIHGAARMYCNPSEDMMFPSSGIPGGIPKPR